MLSKFALIALLALTPTIMSVNAAPSIDLPNVSFLPSLSQIPAVSPISRSVPIVDSIPQFLLQQEDKQQNYHPTKLTRRRIHRLRKPTTNPTTTTTTTTEPKSSRKIKKEVSIQKYVPSQFNHHRSSVSDSVSDSFEQMDENRKQDEFESDNDKDDIDDDEKELVRREENTETLLEEVQHVVLNELEQEFQLLLNEIVKLEQFELGSRPVGSKDLPISNPHSKVERTNAYEEVGVQGARKHTPAMASINSAAGRGRRGSWGRHGGGNWGNWGNYQPQVIVIPNNFPNTFQNNNGGFFNNNPYNNVQLCNYIINGVVVQQFCQNSFARFQAATVDSANEDSIDNINDFDRHN